MTNQFIAKANGNAFKLHSALQVILKDYAGISDASGLNNLAQLFPELYTLVQAVGGEIYLQTEVYLLASMSLPFSGSQKELERQLGRLEYACALIKHSKPLHAYRQVHKGFECVLMEMNGKFSVLKVVADEHAAQTFFTEHNQGIDFALLANGIETEQKKEAVPVQSYSERISKIKALPDIEHQTRQAKATVQRLKLQLKEQNSMSDKQLYVNAVKEAEATLKKLHENRFDLEDMFEHMM